MTLDTSTLNVILAAILGAFGWILAQLHRIGDRVTRIETALTNCKCGQALALTLLLVLLPGCASGGLFTREETIEKIEHTLPAQTNVLQIVTNTVTVLQDRPVTNWMTNVIVQIIPPQSFTTFATNVIVRVNPTVERTIEGAKELNQFNPTPTAGPLNIALGLLSAGLALVARVKSRQARVVPTLIDAVESYGTPELKRAIRSRSINDDTAAELHRQVKART
jgi:hypothetical protein